MDSHEANKSKGEVFSESAHRTGWVFVIF
jgi:hypothetical protein